MIDLPAFDTKKELFEYLIANKSDIMTLKKAEFKHADGFNSISFQYNKADISKADSDTDTELKRFAIINTTNVIDSHKDLHLPGLWNKSLKENKNVMYLQEHKMAFDSVIAGAEDTKASAKYYNWKDLGFDFEGKTQALVFEVKIKKERNKFMFDQFKAGNVSQNSVGMRYVKIDLAVNDEDYEQEFSIWQKYYNNIANKDVADEDGYFWAVSEAKVIEGSAVLLGSNQFTPVRESKGEPHKALGAEDINKFLTHYNI